MKVGTRGVGERGELKRGEMKFHDVICKPHGRIIKIRRIIWTPPSSKNVEVTSLMIAPQTLPFMKIWFLCTFAGFSGPSSLAIRPRHQLESVESAHLSQFCGLKRRKDFLCHNNNNFTFSSIFTSRSRFAAIISLHRRLLVTCLRSSLCLDD